MIGYVFCCGLYVDDDDDDKNNAKEIEVRFSLYT